MSYIIKIKTCNGQCYDEILGDIDLTDVTTRCKNIALSGYFITQNSSLIQNNTHMYFPTEEIDYIYIHYQL